MAKRVNKAKEAELEIVDDIFMVEKNSKKLIGLNPDIEESTENLVIPEGIEIIIMARKTAANPDAYYLDLRVRLSVGCKRRSYFFLLYLPVFSYLRLWYSVH